MWPEFINKLIDAVIATSRGSQIRESCRQTCLEGFSAAVLRVAIECSGDNTAHNHVCVHKTRFWLGDIFWCTTGSHLMNARPAEHTRHALRPAIKRRRQCWSEWTVWAGKGAASRPSNGFRPIEAGCCGGMSSSMARRLVCVIYWVWHPRGSSVIVLCRWSTRFLRMGAVIQDCQRRDDNDQFHWETYRDACLKESQNKCLIFFCRRDRLNRKIFGKLKFRGGIESGFTRNEYSSRNLL